MTRAQAHEAYDVAEYDLTAALMFLSDAGFYPYPPEDVEAARRAVTDAQRRKDAAARILSR